jgi:class 3 adenylate cyclase
LSTRSWSAHHRRWLEHELAQVVVREVESSVGTDALPGAVSVAFLFCDLKDFTAFADARSDVAAVAAIERFGDAVASQRGEHVRPMKSLGDGFMLVYGDAPTAVAAGARIIDSCVRRRRSARTQASITEGRSPGMATTSAARST